MMSQFTLRARSQAAQVAVAVTVLGFYWLANIPEPSVEELLTVSSHLSFERLEIESATNRESRPKKIRQVNTNVRHIDAWISSVGAGVALADIDGDGLPNDVCLVDPRFDTVTVGPAPSTPSRYKPLKLAAPKTRFPVSTTAPMGCLAGDPNEDGQTDLLVYYWGRSPVLFVNKRTTGNTNLQFKPTELVPNGKPWYSNSATFADVDGDGHADLIVGNYFPAESAVLDTSSPTPTIMQSSMSRAENGGRNRLLLWTNDSGRSFFRDATDALPNEGLTAWTLAIGAADIDGDLRPEIYFANDFGPDRLLHNRSLPGAPRFKVVEGSRNFIMPRSKVLGKDSFKGMGVDFGDINGDGRLDIFVSNIAQEYALEESHFAFVNSGDMSAFKSGIAPFTDRSEELGLSRSAWAWDAKIADLDNDGVQEILQTTGFVDGPTDRWPELHEVAMGNDELLRYASFWPRFSLDDGLSGNQPNRLFKLDSSGTYRDVATHVGLGAAIAARGIALGDIDGDGDLDFAIANQWAPSSLYINHTETGRSYLNLDLRYPIDDYAGGRIAVGARARVFLPDFRQLIGQVDGGNGHSGKRSTNLHFGLSDHPENIPLKVELAWRDLNGVHTKELRLLPGHHRIILRSP